VFVAVPMSSSSTGSSDWAAGVVDAMVMMVPFFEVYDA